MAIIKGETDRELVRGVFGRWYREHGIGVVEAPPEPDAPEAAEGPARRLDQER